MSSYMAYRIMNAPIKSFRDYKNSYGVYESMRNTVNWLRAQGLYPR